MSNWAEVEYCTTDFYNPDGERTIIWNDPNLNINWPIAPDEYQILSLKDRQGKILKDSEIYE